MEREGVKVIFTFEPESRTDDISVGAIEVKACSEPGRKSFI